MSTPKKPGTDLAALKARLAKKTGGAADEVPPPGQVAAPEPHAPAMPEIPPPGHVQAPMQAHDVPPPGGYAPEPMQARAPSQGHAVPPPGQMQHIPPPGMQMAPPVQHAPPPSYGADASYGSASMNAGASMGGFDPDAGIIDGGPEIKPRGSKGLVLLAAVAAMAIGFAVGWIGNTIKSKGERIDQGRAKGEKMVEQVTAVSEARKSVSLAMEDLKKDVAENPTAAAEKVGALLTGDLAKQPQVTEMFGWQLASVDPSGVKAVFVLYQKLNDLQGNLQVLANFLGGYGNIMKVGGPSLFGITNTAAGSKLVIITQGLCGEAVDKPETLKPCEELGGAVAFKIQDGPGSEPKTVPRGAGEGQAMLLLPDGPVYQYVVGLEPGNNAASLYKIMMGRIDENLTEMNGAEEKALAALSKYSQDPNVDGSQAPEGG